jgi:glycosyltransferase involved in cell wall biosynthesis
MLSVLEQSSLKTGVDSLTYVVRDGGSVDGTLDIVHDLLDRYRSHGHVKIICVSEADGGMYDALANGFRESPPGDINCYLNAGDLLAPYAFEVVSGVFSDFRVEFLTGVKVVYNDRGHMIRYSLPFAYNKRLFETGFHGTWLGHLQQESTFWSARLQSLVDLSKLAEFKLAGDFYLWSVFMQHANIYVVEAWLGGFRLHAGQLSERYAEEYARELKRIASRRLPTDYCLAGIYWMAEYLPNRLKRVFNRRIVSYNCSSDRYEIRQ